MKKLFLLIFIFSIFLVSCKKEENNQVLNGEFSFEQKDNKTLVLCDNKLANGIIQGSEDILELDYEMFFKKGLPTGKILFYDDNKLLVETALNFNYSTQKATGEIKIFDTNSEDKKVVNIIYKNIDSTVDKFLDLATMKPSLNWYVDNPLNIFSAVEVFKMGKKIAAVSEGKYLFFDDEGNAFDVGINANDEDFNIYDYLEENFDEIDYVDIDTTQQNAFDIFFEPTEVSVKKLQKDELYVSGDFIYLDKANNKVTVKYKNGLPSGKFLIEASDFNFKADGIYDINADMWYGNIYITKGSTYLALKNVLIKGENLFNANNEIIYDWFTIDDSQNFLNVANLYRFLSADIYLNNNNIGVVTEGQYFEK